MVEGSIPDGPLSVASAPGELPTSDILKRVAAQRSQFRHDNLLRPLSPEPDRTTEVQAVSGDQLRLEAAALWYTVDGQAPGRGTACVPMEIVDVIWEPLAGYLTQWRGEIPGQPSGTVVRYCIGGWANAGRSTIMPPDAWAQDGQGFWFQFPAASGLTTFAYRVEAAGPPLPDWVRDAVVYHIFLDRFHPGTPGGRWQHDGDPRGIHGGTLQGVRQTLPSLNDLGVTCLWLSPLSPSPSYHRYDVTDYYAVDPALGTKEDLRDLVDEAHQRGIRVILDFVPAHCSWGHPAFLQAQASAKAPTATWFTFTERPDRYRMFLGSVPSLPSIDAQDPGARAYLIGSAVHWLLACDVDGFRIDHAIGVGMDFHVALNAALRAAKPGSFTVGEVTDSPDCLLRYRNRLDAILDFPLARALRLTFARSEWSVANLCAFLDAYERYMDAGPGRLSFLDNHDMNRFLFMAGNQVERLKLAALCQFTLAPTPIVYFGTEVGLSQERDIDAIGFGGDAEARRDMLWDTALWNEDLRALYRSLVTLRTNHHVLRDGIRRTIHVDVRSQSCAYLRSSTDGIDAGTILVVFNLGKKSAVMPLPSTSMEWKLALSTESEMPWDEDDPVVPPMTGIAMVARRPSTPRM